MAAGAPPPEVGAWQAAENRGAGGVDQADNRGNVPESGTAARMRSGAGPRRLRVRHGSSCGLLAGGIDIQAGFSWAEAVVNRSHRKQGLRLAACFWAAHRPPSEQARRGPDCQAARAAYGIFRVTVPFLTLLDGRCSLMVAPTEHRGFGVDQL
jgi:hypothetical protein